MEDLKIGDVVLTAGGNSKIHGFGHFDKEYETEYIQLATTAQTNAAGFKEMKKAREFPLATPFSAAALGTC